MASSIPASIEPEDAPREVDFGSGALVTVAAGAHLDVLERSDRKVTLALRRGLSRFDIRPGGTRSFRVECAGVTVEVVGTRFSVQRTEEAVRVEVQRGRVLVRGANVPDQVQALDAGQSVVIALTASLPTDTGDTRPRVNAPASHASASAVSRASATPFASAHTASDSEGGAWRRAATQQNWQGAWQTLGAAGVVREAARADNVRDLLALADVARLSGHPGDALVPLRQILSRHPDDPRTALAAFTLGRVLLDALGQPVQAAAAFERALALTLPAALAEDAAARLVQAHARAGALTQAKAAADAYRHRYPTGRRTADVNQWSPP